MRIGLFLPPPRRSNQVELLEEEEEREGGNIGGDFISHGTPPGFTTEIGLSSPSLSLPSSPVFVVVRLLQIKRGGREGKEKHDFVYR